MNEEQRKAHVEAVSASLGLAIAPEHMPGVLENFARLATIAEQVNGFDLGAADEAAPVWRP